MSRAQKSLPALVVTILMVLTAGGASAQTAPCTNYYNSANPQLATCNTGGVATKVFAHDKATIYAPELTDPTNINSAPVYKQCHTVQNGLPGDTSNIPDIFVPWKTAREWSAFLSAAPPSAGAWLNLVVTSGCCIPIKLTKIGCYDVNGNLVSEVPLQTPLSLGNRTIGTPLLSNGLPNNTVASQIYSDDPTQQGQAIFQDLGLSEWGAQQDVSNAAVSTTDANGNPIDYAVTYTCDSSNAHYTDPAFVGQGYGGWIKMHASGSCIPADGACATGSSSFPNNTPPSDLTTLCAIGSVYQNNSLQATNSGWTWQCNGTGGGGCGTPAAPRQCTNAICTASATAPVGGACGIANDTVSSTIPTTASLCATGTASTVVDSTGTVNGPTGPWTWTCEGGVGAPASCATLGAAACGAYGTAPTNILAFGALLNQWNADLSGAHGNSTLITDPNFCKSGCLDSSLTSNGSPTTTASNSAQWGCAASCNGTGGITCRASNASVDGTCNTSSINGALPVLPAIASQLCGKGSSKVFGTGNQEQIDPQYINNGNIIPVGGQFEWQCLGLGGGAESPLCTASYNPLALTGACGSQAPFTTIPGGCLAGSTVCPLCAPGDTLLFAPSLGAGSWWWTCEGVDGGGNSNCNALDPIAPGECGQDVGGNFPTLSSTDSNLCGGAGGFGSPINFNVDTTNYIYTWNCTNADGTSPQCVAYIPGWCGSAANTTVTSTTLSNSALCSSGTPAVQPQASGTLVPGTVLTLSPSGRFLRWDCNGFGGGSTCDATMSTAQPGVCGTGSAGACAIGTATTPVCTGTSCTWTCSTSTGTSPTCTSLNTSLPTADGACGAANGQPTYVTPNANLCSGGQPSSVSGTGPWSWTCFGTGSSTVNASCNAFVCSQCTGTYTRTNSAARNGMINSCNVTATASWTETDTICAPGDPSCPSANITNSLSLSWTDPMGAFSHLVNSVSATSLSPSAGAAAYCGPCDLQLAHVSNAQITVTGVSGTCSQARGDVLIPTNVAP